MEHHAPPQQSPYTIDVKPHGTSVLDKMKSKCAGNPSVAIAIIVALVVLVAYLFATLRGWIGDAPETVKASQPKKSQPRSAGKASKASKASKARAPPEDEDETVDDLIAALNEG